MYIKDSSLIVSTMNRFFSYIQVTDCMSTGILRSTISFTDKNCLLGREEDYKLTSAINGRNALQVEKWTKSWIGTGKIANRAAKAIGKAGNLVNPNQQTDFRNRLNPDHPKYTPNAEQALFNIYCGTNPASSFAEAISVFGAKYDTIAYLYFMKDYEQYLPISPGNFDQAFQSVGIDFTTSYKCGWDNYCKYICIIREIQTLLNQVLPLESKARLIDAHSFMWFINEERFRRWIPDAELTFQIEVRTEECLHEIAGSSPRKHMQNGLVYDRNAQVVKRTRKLANGICRLCNQPAPFSDKYSEPYLEVHHVTWLSRGGIDSICNTVALCPNCHTKMHIVDDSLDVEYLHKIAVNQEE